LLTRLHRFRAIAVNRGMFCRTIFKVF